jgi:hypothetical protein
MSTVDCCWYWHEQVPLFGPAYFDRWNCVGIIIIIIIIVVVVVVQESKQTDGV